MFKYASLCFDHDLSLMVILPGFRGDSAVNMAGFVNLKGAFKENALEVLRLQ